MKLQLIPEARHWWRMFSMQAMSIAFALLGAWNALPSELQARLPASLVVGIASVLVGFGMLGRLVHQESVRPTLPPEAPGPPEGSAP